MKYSIGTKNNYPSKAYGKFTSANQIDYLLFRNIEPIALDIRLDFVDFETISTKWDCISTDKVYIYLINSRVESILNQHYKGDFELINVSIYSNNYLLNTNYKLLHILNHTNKNTIFLNEGIWVDEWFVEDFKKAKLKGWTFYREDE